VSSILLDASSNVVDVYYGIRFGNNRWTGWIDANSTTKVDRITDLAAGATTVADGTYGGQNAVAQSGNVFTFTVILPSNAGNGDSTVFIAVGAKHGASVGFLAQAAYHQRA
jgi:hypothetical protein